MNAKAWDWESKHGNIWTEGTDGQAVSEAKMGNPSIRLTTFKPTPLSWLEPFRGKDILCIGSGGGQQAVLFSAYGCNVTDIDISGRQLEKDREMAEKFHLDIATEEGDMLYGLCDCNSFYASCERLYRPDLLGKPVAVLSNNDGCVVALTREAKQAGLKRGDALFKVEDVVRKGDIVIFSSNYPLYQSISDCVMYGMDWWLPTGIQDTSRCLPSAKRLQGVPHP